MRQRASHGGTEIDSGTVTLGAGGALAAGSAVAVDGGVLDLASHSQVLGDVSGTGGTISLGGGTLTLGTANATALAAALAGNGTVVKQGSGTLTLEGADTLDGAITIAAGTLELAGDTSNLGASIADAGSLVFSGAGSTSFAGAISGSGSVTKQGGGSLSLSGALTSTGGLAVSGATLQLTGSALSYSGPIADAATLALATSQDISFADAISGSGGLRIDGPGDVTLTASEAYTGGTAIEGGRLTLGTGASLVAGSALTVDAGTFDLDGQSLTIGILGGATGSIALGGGTLTLATTGSDYFGGDITGPGAFVLQGGSLSVSAALSLSGTITIAAGTLTFTGDTSPMNASLIDDGALIFAQGLDSAYTGAISGTGSITQAGSGVLALSVTPGFTGAIQVNAGTLDLSGGLSGLSGGITVDGGVLALQSSTTNLAENIGLGTNNANVTFAQTADSSYAGVISGNGSVIQAGTGVLTLSGANSYAGITTILSGTLKLAGSAAVDAPSPLYVDDSHLVVAPGSQNMSLTDITGTGDVTIQAGGAEVDASPGGAYSFSGGTTIDGGTLGLFGSSFGTGTIGFAPDASGTLEIYGAEALTNAVGGLTAFDTINFSALTLIPGTYFVGANDVLSLSGTDYSANPVQLALQLQGVAVGTAFNVAPGALFGSSIALAATSFDVTNAAQLATALQAIDLGGVDSAANSHYQITIDANLTGLLSDLPAIDLAAGSTLSILGNGHTLDAGGTVRGLFAYAGTVTISDLTIANATAAGGIGGSGAYGGGGGAGLGGGLFVGTGATVTLSGVSFTGDRAVGGAGGSASGIGLGGGGGLGGAGGNGGAYLAGTGGGGGIGGMAKGAGGDYGGPYSLQSESDQPGIVKGVPADYASGLYRSPAGGGGAPYVGGGIGGALNGTGGFGGGGSGGMTGGYGGGGGAKSGAGGFGGGGGGGAQSGAGGFGAGAGGTGGGGGLGAGGAIFVQQGGVLTIADGTLSGSSVAGGAGADSGDAGQGIGAGLFFGGTGTLQIGAAAGQTTVIADTITDGTGAGSSGALTVAIGTPGHVTLSAANSFSGGIMLGGGATLELGVAGSAGTGAIQFQPGTSDTLQIDGSAMPVNVIGGLAIGDLIDFSSVAYSTQSAVTLLAGNILQISAASATEDLQLAPGDDFTQSLFQLMRESSGTGTVVTDSAVPCYCPGTLILTDRGEIPVEKLAIGDRVMTPDGAEPIGWIGRRAYAGRFLAGQAHLLPIRIEAGALGAGLPRRDLRVSPLHALLLDGVLIPAGLLVNGVSIVQEQDCQSVEYIHIELAAHGLVFAEGALAETFIDDDSRGLFHNAAEYRALYPDAVRQPVHYCAPRVEDGFVLEAVRGRLASLRVPLCTSRLLQV